MFTLATLIPLLIAIVIVGLIVYCLLWLLNKSKLPDIFKVVGETLIVLFAVVWLIYKLIPFIK